MTCNSIRTVKIQSFATEGKLDEAARESRRKEPTADSSRYAAGTRK
jgi:hypothetical protein